ncbi:hypothetical protein GC173_07935 [bacterium]|nr:hypothetical protein [bacterium]
MLRASTFVACYLLLSRTLVSAPLPPEWKDSDLSGGPARWYAVAVAEFPSATLAQGVEAALRAQEWGPVRVEQSDGVARVLVGELSTVAEADYLRRELKQQSVAEGRVVVVPASSEAPRVLHGPLLPPFELPADPRFTADVMIERVKALELSNQLEQGQGEALVAALSKEGDLPGDIGLTAVLVAERCMALASEADLALYLSCTVASGVWPATVQHRERAQQLAASLLYGHLRDWRAAWSASRAIALNSSSAVYRTEARLRLAALQVELVREGGDQTPSFVEVRRQIRQAYELAPEADQDVLLERAQIFYINTFAWEGAWDRVEILADDFLKTHDATTAQGVMARTLLAKSLLRKELYSEARELLTSAVATPLNATEFLPLGFASRDPRNAAIVALRQLGRIEAGSDPLPAPVTVDEESRAAGVSTVAPPAITETEPEPTPAPSDPSQSI